MGNILRFGRQNTKSKPFSPIPINRKPIMMSLVSLALLKLCTEAIINSEHHYAENEQIALTFYQKHKRAKNKLECLP